MSFELLVRLAPPSPNSRLRVDGRVPQPCHLDFSAGSPSENGAGAFD